jgi:hypothetical protein
MTLQEAILPAVGTVSTAVGIYAAAAMKRAAGRLERSGDDINYELKPNSGRSLRDVVNRMESRIAAIEDRIDLKLSVHAEVLAELQRIKFRLRSDADALPNVAQFECSADGRCEWVSARWLEWGEMHDRSAAIGFGWVNGIHPEDRAMVRKEWESAVAEARDYELEYRMVSGKRVLGRGIPVFGPDRTILSWVGTIELIDAK